MRRVFRIVLGFFVLIVGLILALPGIPGPGIAIMIVGLIILSEHFQWAERLLAWAKAKAERLRDKALKKRGIMRK
jgi:uncharacterized protein (TIGR02611 family)